MEKFFWMMYDHFKSQDETFIKAKHKGKLSRFKLRNIYAIDSTTIKLAYWQSLWFYGIAPPPENVVLLANAPYLPGFEKMSAKSMG